MNVKITPRTIVEAFLPFSGETALRDIYDAANLAGVEDQPIRLAIRRLVAAGEVIQRGRGRGGSLGVTDAGRGRLQRDRYSVALAFAQDAGALPWDGRWRLTAVSVPERERAVRDVLRRELSDLGAVAISTGLYVSPHDLRDALQTEAGQYLSTATCDDLDVHGENDPRLIAEALWPGAPVIDAYSHIERALADDDNDLSSPGVVRQLRLAEALERAMRDDPLLPVELREGPWAPTRIRAAWAQRWDALQTAPGGKIYEGWWEAGLDAFRPHRPPMSKTRVSVES
ncbi:PaaX family transcriptional regulator [Microbacterium sp. PMB16]|uniref:PaaX family transcriptional regulator n=1 Tax=Microbacterium sp. PMB16 TaxID=3120157 RepID=UPI003F4B1B2B